MPPTQQTRSLKLISPRVSATSTALRSCARRWLENERTWMISANPFRSSLGLARVARDEDRLGAPNHFSGLDAAHKRVAEHHDRRAAAALGHALRLAKHDAVDAILLQLRRPRRDAAQAGEKAVVENLEVRRLDQAVDELRLLDQPRERGEHLQVVARRLVRRAA